MCVKLGVDPKTYYEVVKNGGGMAYSTYFDRRALRVIEGNFDPTFTLDLMLKDVTLAAQMAGVDSGTCRSCARHSRRSPRARAGGWSDEDFSGVTHVVEKRFGKKIAPPSP